MTKFQLAEQFIIHARIGQVQATRNSIRTTGSLPVADHIAGPEAWKSFTPSWSPPDDVNFALDPNAELYNLALEGSVMEDPPEAKKKKKARSQVSVSQATFW